MSCRCGRVHAVDELSEQAKDAFMSEWVGRVAHRCSEVVRDEVLALDAGFQTSTDAIVSAGVAALSSQLRIAACLRAVAEVRDATGDQSMESDAAEAHPAFRGAYAGNIAVMIEAATSSVVEQLGGRVHVVRVGATPRRSQGEPS